MNNTCTLVQVRNPFGVVGEQDASVIVPGNTVRDVVMPIIQASSGIPMTVQVNGQWLLRDSWDHVLQVGDIITVHRETHGGGNGSDILRSVLMIVAIAALNVVLPGSGTVLGAVLRVGAAIAVSALLNNLIPPSQQGGGGGGSPASGSPTFNFAIRGNRLASLDDPIPVGYGFMRVYPRFAAQPYGEYVDNEQFYHAVLVIGQGLYDIPRIEIDDTDINHFQDVQKNIVQPGGSLTLVDHGVVSAPEIDGQDLLTAKPVGGFAACGRGLSATSLGVDIIFQRGLGVADGATMLPKTVTIRFDVRQIDNFGAPTSSWIILHTQEITEATTTAVRKSFKYTLPLPMRCEIRAVRLDIRDDSFNVLNDPIWGGLRAYISTPGTLASTATYLELKIRASEQLGALSQTQISVFRHRKLRTWSLAGWGVEVPSRSIAWAIADILTNTVYGEKLPDNRVDLSTLLVYDSIWTERQDRFDFEFDVVSTAIAAANIAAKCGRAVCIPRGNVVSVMRDQQQTLPIGLFTPRNMLGEDGGSTFALDIALPSRKTPDGVSLRYFSNRTWQFETVICPSPGLYAAECVNLQQETILGIGGSKQAEREGLYLAADTFYRRVYAEWLTELDGTLPAYGTMVMVAHDLPAWGQFGDVVNWDVDTLTLTLSESLAWGSGDHWIRLQLADGTSSRGFLVTPGIASNEVVLTYTDSVDPGSGLLDPGNISFAHSGRERTKYAFGNAFDGPVPHRIRSLEPQDRWRVRVGTVLEDDRVHIVDNHLLPGPGEIQDPIDGIYDYYDPGAGDFFLATINDVTFGASVDLPFSPVTAGYRLTNAGIAETFVIGTQSSINSIGAGQWLNIQPATPIQTVNFEVRATLRPFSFAIPGAFSGTLDTWEVLDVNREWSATASGDGNAFAVILLIEIRSVADGIVQDSALVHLFASITGGIGGG